MEYSFPKNLRSARKAQNMTQSELAFKVGVAQSTLSEWEGSTIYPTIDRVYDLARVLEIPINKLIDDSMEESSQAE